MQYNLADVMLTHMAHCRKLSLRTHAKCFQIIAAIYLTDWKVFTRFNRRFFEHNIELCFSII